MLTNTFCHLPGIGFERERKLWSAGITTWNSLLSHTGLGSLPGFKPAWLSHLKDSQDRLAVHDCTSLPMVCPEIVTGVFSLTSVTPAPSSTSRPQGFFLMPKSPRLPSSMAKPFGTMYAVTTWTNFPRTSKPTDSWSHSTVSCSIFPSLNSSLASACLMHTSTCALF